MSQPIQISCLTADWREAVARALTELQEIDLIHFLFSDDIGFCEDVASRYAVDFTATPKKHVAFFKKRMAPKVSK